MHKKHSNKQISNKYNVTPIISIITFKINDHTPIKRDCQNVATKEKKLNCMLAIWKLL